MVFTQAKIDEKRGGGSSMRGGEGGLSEDLVAEGGLSAATAATAVFGGRRKEDGHGSEGEVSEEEDGLVE